MTSFLRVSGSTKSGGVLVEVEQWLLPGGKLEK
jgi:hypothetical protein